MMMQEEAAGSNNAAARQNQAGFGAGGAPPGFTVITPQVDLTARWWKLLHFVLSVLFGVGVVYAEYSRQGDLGRFDALATDKPMPYGVYQVAPMVTIAFFVLVVVDVCLGNASLKSCVLFCHTCSQPNAHTYFSFFPLPFSFPFPFSLSHFPFPLLACVLVLCDDGADPAIDPYGITRRDGVAQQHLGHHCRIPPSTLLGHDPDLYALPPHLVVDGQRSLGHCLYCRRHHHVYSHVFIRTL